VSDLDPYVNSWREIWQGLQRPDCPLQRLHFVRRLPACHLSGHFGDLRQEEGLILGNRKPGLLFIAFFKG